MVLTKEQLKELGESTKPLIKFLCEHCHPHVQVIVNTTGAELLEGIAMVNVKEFIKD